jgi:hypothetical protein
MLATILKSPRATQTTIAIVEAFTKLRELSRNLEILNSADTEVIEPEILETTGSLFNDLFFSHYPTASTETSVELNLGIAKMKRTIKSENSDLQKKIDELQKIMIDMKSEIKRLKT